jgi:hypothetical protein
VLLLALLPIPFFVLLGVIFLDSNTFLPFFNSFAHFASLNQGEARVFAHCISASVARYQGSHPVPAQVTLAHISSPLFRKPHFCCPTRLSIVAFITSESFVVLWYC